MARKSKKIKITQEEIISEKQAAGVPAETPSGAPPPEAAPTAGAPAGQSATPGQPQATGPAQPSGEAPESQPTGTQQKPPEKEISPSLKQGELSKPVDLSKKQQGKDKKEQAKDALKDKAGGVTKDAGKKALKQVAKQAAKAAARAIASAAASAASAALGAVGWPVLIGCLAIGIIVIALGAGMMCIAFKGYPGKTYPNPAGKNDTNVQKIIELEKKSSQGPYHVIDFLSNEDKDYVEAGKLDKRLAAALVYLAERHNRIGISYVISTYNTMPTNPEDSSQLSSNVSAHKEGLAADIAEIDFVYKAYVPNAACSEEGAVDLVYYADKPVNVSGTSAAGGQISTSDNGLNSSIDALLAKLDQLSQDADFETRLQIDRLKAQLEADKSNNARVQQATTELNNQIIALEAQLQNQTGEQLAELKQKIAQLKTAVSQMQQALYEANQVIAQFNGQLEDIQTQIANGQRDLDKIRSTLDTIQSFQNIGLMRDLGSIADKIGALSGDISSLIQDIQNSLPNFNDLMNQFNFDFGGLGGIPGFGGIGGDYKELLRLFCEGNVSQQGDANTTINGNLAKAIPIKVAWQDDKPDIQHVSAAADESTSTDPRVFNMVYRPQAREKTHNVISQLLQFPYDMNDVEYYKVTQLITYSYERDVAPFAEKLDVLYGKIRPGNYGLFSMPESWAQVHIGY